MKYVHIRILLVFQLKTKQKDINVKDIVNKLKTIFTNEDDKDKIHKFIQ